MGLSAPILAALREEGYTTPTPIQAQAIPHAIDGRDILGCAQTGTGKTAAFALPILHRLQTARLDPKRRDVHPRALILSPTRELAGQIDESFAAYGHLTGLSGTVIYGGVSQHRQVQALRRGVDVLVATPGRLMDLMDQGLVSLHAIEILVLDEADRMLDMGFIQPIRRIASKIPSKGRQTLLFSATMPRQIQDLANSLLRDPVRVTIKPERATTELIEQSVYMVDRQKKRDLLLHMLGDEGVARAVVFTRTKHGADKVAKHLERSGISSDAIHGNKAQNQRQRALDRFRDGRTRVLVATDVAARGLDVDGITHVFNFDLPVEPEAYVHRIGRTGRAGARGSAIAFCDRDERNLLRDIERITGKRVPMIDLPDFPSLPPMPDRDTLDDADRNDRRYAGGGRNGRSYPASRGGSRNGGGGGGSGRPAPRPARPRNDTPQQPARPAPRAEQDAPPSAPRPSNAAAQAKRRPGPPSPIAGLQDSVTPRPDAAERRPIERTEKLTPDLAKADLVTKGAPKKKRKKKTGNATTDSAKPKHHAAGAPAGAHKKRRRKPNTKARA